MIITLLCLACSCVVVCFSEDIRAHTHKPTLNWENFTLIPLALQPYSYLPSFRSDIKAAQRCLCILYAQYCNSLKLKAESMTN